MANMYYVYILRSLKAKKSYVGSTDNVEERLSEHNNGQSKFTSIYRPWELIYTEEFETRQQASEKEKYFKIHSGRNWMKKNLF